MALLDAGKISRRRRAEAFGFLFFTGAFATFGLFRLLFGLLGFAFCLGLVFLRGAVGAAACAGAAGAAGAATGADSLLRARVVLRLTRKLSVFKSTSAILRAVAGLLFFRARKASLLRRISTAGSLQATSAERGLPSIRAISPKNSPPLSRLMCFLSPPSIL